MALVQTTRWLTGNMSMSVDLVRANYNLSKAKAFHIINLAE
jgi:hypothetical protein